MNHDQDCPCATDNVPHGAGCADCSCVKNICPTCEGEVKGEIVDGKCRACQLGVIPDWMKPKDTEKRFGLNGDPYNIPCPHANTKEDFGAKSCADCGQPLMR